MKWYKTLSIHQKINLKDSCILIVGLDFVSLRMLFSLKDIIELLHNKLKLEGFAV